MLARFNINRNKKQLMVVKREAGNQILEIEGGENKRDRYKRSANMRRSPCSDDSGLKKGPWTPEEDEKLVNYIQKHGHSSWTALPKRAGICFVLFLFYSFSCDCICLFNSLSL